MYSEKATKLCEISTVDFSYVVKSTVEISQNFVAFSEYMNFIMFVFPLIQLGHFPKGPFIYYVISCRGGGGSENSNF